MISQDLQQYIKPEAGIIVPILILLGYAIKKTPKVPDWLIPYALIVIGAVLSMAVLGWNIGSAIQGILCAGSAITIHQLFKQGVEGIQGSND